MQNMVRTENFVTEFCVTHKFVWHFSSALSGCHQSDMQNFLFSLVLQVLWTNIISEMVTYMDGICMHIQQFYVSLDTDCRRTILAPGRTCIEFVFGTLRLLFAVTNTVIKNADDEDKIYKYVHGVQGERSTVCRNV